MKKEKDKEKMKPSILNEPEVRYHENRLEIFSCFEDENEATAELNSRLSHEENFRKAHEMIKAMYQKELDNMPKIPYYNITFTMIDGLPV